MTIFLTGERQVGKSTALRRYLRKSGLRARGFMTDFGTTRYNEEKTLLLLPWGDPPDYSAGQVCARIGLRNKQVDPPAFDLFGVRLLLEAAADPACGLIVMDELGFLEADAQQFRDTVLQVLSGPKPVVGVVRQGLGIWKGAPLGTLLTVTKENRDRIPDTLGRILSSNPSK